MPHDPGSATMTAARHSPSLATIVLGLAGFIAPLLAVYAPLGMAPLFAVVAAVMAPGLIAHWRDVRPARPSIIIAACLLLWCAASLIWTLNPKGALVVLGQLSGVLLCTIVAFGSAAFVDSRPVARALLAGILLALAIYVLEATFNAPILFLLKGTRSANAEALYSTFNRGLAVLIVLTPAVVLAFRKSHPRLCAILAVAVALVVFFYFGSSMQVATVVAFAVFALALMRSWLIRLVGIIAVIGMMAAPLVAYRLITPELIDSVSRRDDTVSPQHRLVIWHFAAERIAEKPLIGWGLDSARVMPGGKDVVKLHAPSCQDPCYITGEMLPLHPHNVALHLWLELGFVGVALAAIAILWIFWAIAAAPVSRWDRAILAAQASGGLVIAGLSYGAWQSWWLSTLALAAVLSVCMIRTANREPVRHAVATER